jgi:hypothetical protein
MQATLFCVVQEIMLGNEHISFKTAKIGSLLDINESKGLLFCHFHYHGTSNRYEMKWIASVFHAKLT